MELVSFGTLVAIKKVLSNCDLFPTERRRCAVRKFVVVCACDRKLAQAQNSITRIAAAKIAIQVEDLRNSECMSKSLGRVIENLEPLKGIRTHLSRLQNKYFGHGCIAG